MEEHQKNSLQVGRWLEKHPAIESVRHPGLPSHPQHHIVLKQCYGHSGMISFYLRGKLEQSRKFLSSLKVKAMFGYAIILVGVKEGMIKKQIYQIAPFVYPAR